MINPLNDYFNSRVRGGRDSVTRKPYGSKDNPLLTANLLRNTLSLAGLLVIATIQHKIQFVKER